MTKRKLISALLALTIALSVTACADKSSSDSDSGSSSQNETTTTAVSADTGTLSVTSSQAEEDEPPSAPQNSIICGKYYISVNDVDNAPQWEFTKKGKIGGKARTSCSFATDYYTCFMEIVTADEISDFLGSEEQDNAAFKTGTLDHSGKKAKYQVNLFKNGDSNDVRSFFTVLPLEKDYYAVLSVAIGARYIDELQGDMSLSEQDAEKKFKEWYNQNKGTAFSTDPKDYLYIFDSLDIR